MTNKLIDTDLRLENYSGNLPKYTIRAIRHYQYTHREDVAKWNKDYYQRNKEDIKFNIGKRRALARLKNGKNVSEKTRLKYEI